MQTHIHSTQGYQNIRENVVLYISNALYHCVFFAQDFRRQYIYQKRILVCLRGLVENHLWSSTLSNLFHKNFNVISFKYLTEFRPYILDSFKLKEFEKWQVWKGHSDLSLRKVIIPSYERDILPTLGRKWHLYLQKLRDTERNQATDILSFPVCSTYSLY